MRRWLLIGIVLLTMVTTLALGVAPSSGPEFPAAEPAPLDPAIAAWIPLAVGEPRTFHVNCTNGSRQNWTRVVAGWEAVDGEAHARVDTGSPVARAEWLRPGRGPKGEAQLVCTIRQLDDTRHRLDPPQPVLQTPLEVGATWTWKGRIGEAPCEATFRILAVSKDALQVEQHTAAGSLSSTHVRTYARAHGLVAESANLPTDDPALRSDLRQTATLAESD